MTTVELVASIVTGVVTVIGSGGVGSWLTSRSRTHRAQLAAETDAHRAKLVAAGESERLRLDHDGRVAPQLLNRLSAIETAHVHALTELAAIKVEHAQERANAQHYHRKAERALEASQECERHRSADRERCDAELAQRDERIDALRVDVGILAARLREQRASIAGVDPEDTGLLELDAMAVAALREKAKGRNR